MCDDTCHPANTREQLQTSDGVCDDGGPGAEWSDCPYGTDCRDCGPRCGPSVPPMALMLFGGRLFFNAKASLLALDDGWIRFKVQEEVATVIVAGRRQLDAMFERKMNKPDADLSKEGGALIEVVAKLIANHAGVGT